MRRTKLIKYSILFDTEIIRYAKACCFSSAQDNFMMIPTSFIVINPSSVINDHNEDAYTCQSAALNLDGDSPLCARTASLISDTANCLETQPVEFHCRVITVLMQILVGLLNNLLL